MTRTIEVDDEALTGQDNRGKMIANIANRALTKAGVDLGVKRASTTTSSTRAETARSMAAG